MRNAKSYPTLALNASAPTCDGNRFQVREFETAEQMQEWIAKCQSHHQDQWSLNRSQARVVAKCVQKALILRLSIINPWCGESLNCLGGWRRRSFRKAFVGWVLCLWRCLACASCRGLWFDKLCLISNDGKVSVQMQKVSRETSFGHGHLTHEQYISWIHS